MKHCRDCGIKVRRFVRCLSCRVKHNERETRRYERAGRKDRPLPRRLRYLKSDG